MKVVVLVLVVVALIFAVVLGLSVRDDRRGFGDPSGSRLGAIEDLFPPRTLSGKDARKTGTSCAEGDGFSLQAGRSCSLVIARGIKRVVLRRTPGSSPVTVTLTPPRGVNQTVDTTKAGPDQRDPDAYRLAVTDDGSVLTLTCDESGPCRVLLDGR